MARNDYTCPVCGKVLKIAGPRNTELHEKSKFHIAAMKQDNEIVQELIKEPVQEPNVTGIQTTVLEVKNEQNKETRGHKGQHTEDTGEWDGFLC